MVATEDTSELIPDTEITSEDIPATVVISLATGPKAFIFVNSESVGLVANQEVDAKL